MEFFIHFLETLFMIGYTYILLCSNGKYYTGSTNDLVLRMQQHHNGEGAHFTRKFLPVELKFVEIFERIDYAFNREKQIQGWRRAKKEALINGNENMLPELSKSYQSILIEMGLLSTDNPFDENWERI